MPFTDGEECDCGYNYEECLEKCCYPRQISETDKLSNPEAAGCHRKPAARCSPSEGPCCDGRSCSYVHSRTHLLCKQDTECSFVSYCNGTSAQCPNPTPRKDLTACNDGTQVRIHSILKFEIINLFTIETHNHNFFCGVN